MKSFIEQLYYGNIAPYAAPPPGSSRARAAQKRYQQAYDAFIAKLEPQLRQECSQMIEAHTEESCFDSAESFVRGYRLGALMMMDVFEME